MPTETTANTRTLRAYAADLLEYPRWIIDREVDFTDCRLGGHYNAATPECAKCRFGVACRWLDQHRTPSLEGASLDELIAAIESASEYLQTTHQEGNDPEFHNWIHKVHRFQKARRG